MQKIETEAQLEDRAVQALKSMTDEQRKYAVAMLAAVSKAFPAKPRLRLVVSNSN
jgi:hypothetical protein